MFVQINDDKIREVDLTAVEYSKIVVVGYIMITMQLNRSTEEKTIQEIEQLQDELKLYQEDAKYSPHDKCKPAKQSSLIVTSPFL